MSPEAAYSVLTRAQLSYEYLHTNSTTHEFLFGAIVELVDNAHDANATRIDIFSESRPDLRGNQMLTFLDDGQGMNRAEVGGVMTFGYSQKRRDPFMIGQYGNGLKSGAMRIGKDFILFTKKDDELTCVFLSRSFHEAEKIDEVIVPMPSFTLDKQPITHSEKDKIKHELEISIILKFSPFKKKEEFMKQFDKIQSKTGTMVVVYNLRLLENGDPELDVLTDKTDIILADPDGRDLSLVPERNSLQAYLAIVYAEPRMKILIQHQKVRTRRVISCLYKPKQYKYSSSRFTARAEKECVESKEHERNAKERQAEAESKLRDFENRNGISPTDQELRIEWRKLQDQATLAKQEARCASERAKEKEKHRNDPKCLTFYFGFNLEQRNHDGCMIYNNGRLIKMYQKVGPQIEGGIKCLGVVGVVDVPYVVLEPTHNKQDFADSREYRALLKAMGEYMNQYWIDMELAKQPGGLPQFWERFGYMSADYTSPPSQEPTFVTRRLMFINMTVQCDDCLKWRNIPFKSNMVNEKFPNNWVCSMSHDTSANKCSISEKRVSMQEGKLVKAAVSHDKKREELSKKIEKQQKELDLMSKRKQVTSSKEANKIIARTPSPPPVRASAQRASDRMQGSAKKENKAESHVKEKEETAKPKTKAEMRRLQEEEKRRKIKVEEERDRKKRQAELERIKKKRQANAKKKISAIKQKKATVVESEEESSSGEEEVVVKRVQNAKKTVNTSSVSNSTSHRRGSPTRRRPPSPVTSDIASKKLRRSEADSNSAKKKNEKEVEAVSSTADTTAEVSSTSADKEKVDQLVARMRHLLSFFLPPQWKLTKEQVNQMSADDLIGMDMKSFFTAYENGLKSLVNQHQRAAETSRSKLVNLRRNSSAMLAFIHAELTPPVGETESDQVDICMQQCLTHLRNQNSELTES